MGKAGKAAKKVANKITKAANIAKKSEEAALKGLEEVKNTSKALHHADIIDAGAPLGNQHIVTVNNINYAKLTDAERAAVDAHFPSAKGDRIRAAQAEGKNLYYEGVLAEDQGLKNLSTQTAVTHEQARDIAEKSSENLSSKMEKAGTKSFEERIVEDNSGIVFEEPPSTLNEPIVANTKQKSKLRTNNAFDESMLVTDDVIVAKPTQDYFRKEGIVPDGMKTQITQKDSFNVGTGQTVRTYEPKVTKYGFDYEQEGFKTPQMPENVERRKPGEPIQFWNKRMYRPVEENSTTWSSTAKAALGTAVVGAGICAALSSNRGQQNNAQLYGQQPLY